MWRIGSLIFVTMALCAGCSQNSDSDDLGSSDSQAKEVKKAPHPSATIGTLKYRKQTVHILADGRYTVKDKHGKVLAAGLNEWELAEKYPFLYERVVEGQADGSLLGTKPAQAKRVDSGEDSPAEIDDDDDDDNDEDQD